MPARQLRLEVEGQALLAMREIMQMAAHGPEEGGRFSKVATSAASAPAPTKAETSST